MKTTQPPVEGGLDANLQRGLIWVLRVSLVAAALYSGWQADWETMLISIVVLGLTGLPQLIEHRYHLRLPVEYDFILVVIIYASIFLGEVGDAYERFWWWDVVLHASSGVVLAFAGFLILFSLHHRRKLEASPFLMSWFAFAFSLAIGVLWEIFEFAVDSVFGSNLQKSGLRDTMSDLIVDGIGALIVARLAYNFVRYGHGGLIGRWVASFLRQNPQLRK